MSSQNRVTSKSFQFHNIQVNLEAIWHSGEGKLHHKPLNLLRLRKLYSFSLIKIIKAVITKLLRKF